MASIRLFLPGGSRVESIPGQSYVTGRMLAEGTLRRDWRRLAEELEDRGVLLAASGSSEGIGITLDALAVDWEWALDRAAEMILEPSFPEERCRWVCRQTLAELASLADQPAVLTGWAFQRQLYAPHPRCRPVQGDAESLARLTSADCVTFHRRSLESRPIVTVAGAVDAEAVERRVSALLGDVGGGRRRRLAPSPPEGLGERMEVALDDADQAHLYLGHLTVDRRHPSAIALEVLAVVLGAGSGLSGRLPARIRERDGLAYAVYVQTLEGAGLDPGRFLTYLGTSPDSVAAAEAAVRQELVRLLDEGVSEEEVRVARAYLLGREPFRRETPRQWADLMVLAEHYGLPFDDFAWRRERLRAIDREVVQRAATEHLRPGDVRVTVGRPR